jgi:heme exporter protein D
MNWGSLGDFLHMGGYGLYVWGSYGLCFLLLGLEIWLLRQRRKTLLSRLSRMERDFAEDSNNESTT